jgi:hypothetical protein
MESAMTKLILYILLGATTVHAGDTKDSHRAAMEFCSQFVILDPGPGIRLGYRVDCLDDQDDDGGTRTRWR